VRDRGCARQVHLRLIISATEVLLQPDIKTDEEIAAAHFFDLKLGSSAAAIAPGNRNTCPGIAANHRFKGDFHRQIKMRCDQRSAAIDGGPPIRLEGVREIIVFNSKQALEELVGKTIQEQLNPRVVDHSSTFHEAAAEDAIITFVQELPIAHHVPAIVRLIGHHDYRRVAFHLIEAADNCAAKPM